MDTEENNVRNIPNNPPNVIREINQQPPTTNPNKRIDSYVISKIADDKIKNNSFRVFILTNS
jgi:hypothetical protein